MSGGRNIVWSEAAQALFALSGPTAVSAGAGSGKTTCLVELCLRLFSGEATGASCEPSSVVAITFTEKAALELEERLREGVADRAAAAAARGDEADARAWCARLQALDRMAIGTIHGFAGRILREHALEAGLDPDFEVADEERAQAWRREAARAAVVAALDAGRPQARLLVGAFGAGGRRSGLADALVELARERATLGEVESMAPSPDGQEEAQAARSAAIEAASSILAARAEVRTASGQKAMVALADAMGRLAPGDRSGPLELGSLERFGALRAAVSGWRVGASDGEGAKARRQALQDACDAFGLAAAEALAGDQKRELCALLSEAERGYAARKCVARAVDFDDLLVRARDLLRQDPAVRHELRGRLTALLVDEYQDVNALQQELIELLSAREDTMGEANAAPILVAVGDLKQSIYRFRGADVAVFRGLIERFAGVAENPPGHRPLGGGRVLHLSVNHRSGAGVLELVNEVFSRCMQPIGASPRPYELVFRDSDRLTARREGGQQPACEILVDDEEGKGAERRVREASGLAARIEALVSGKAGVEVRERAPSGDRERARRPRYGDVAILFRRLTQIAPYERALRQAGIPYRLARGGGFYQAPEVRDLGELLASLTRPDDAIAWAALLRSPLCGIGEGALFVLARLGLGSLARRKPEDVVAALLQRYPEAARPWPDPQLDSTEAARLERFLSVWGALRRLCGRVPLGELLARAVEALDLEAAHLVAPDGERRLANLRKALALAEHFARSGGGAAGFADRLRVMAGRPPREPEADLEPGDAVALLSVHQAKGLEWPIVFVPDLGAEPPNDGRRMMRDAKGRLATKLYDPGTDLFLDTASVVAAREEGKRAAAAESRRLLYVALTRARDRLVLSGEARRGETWRNLVEAGVAARSALALRIPLSDAGSFAVGDAIAEEGSVGDSLKVAEAMALDRGADVLCARVQTERRGAARVAVTELAEHARCARRVFLARHLGLPEPGRGSGNVQDDPDRATARGTLAHAMLSELDLCALPLERGPLLAAVAARHGYDPEVPGVRRILVDVARFLEAPAGRRLAQAARAGALRREVPFLMRLEATRQGETSSYLVGAIDAIVEGPREVSVLDFKYALARPEAADRYRFQLLAYVYALSRTLPGRRVVAALQFLRGNCGTFDLTPTAEELERFPHLAMRVAKSSQDGVDLRRTPTELGRDEVRCRAEGCGFADRCFRSVPGAPLENPA